MGWLELQAWLAVMKRQNEPATSSPDSWAGSEYDPWWREQRQRRDAERQELYG